MKVKELIEALETNPAKLHESRDAYMSDDMLRTGRIGPCGCALGIAYAAKVGDAQLATEHFMAAHRESYYMGGWRILAKFLGISPGLGKAIDQAHFLGKLTALQIGRHLRRLGSRRFTATVNRALMRADSIKTLLEHEAPCNQPRDHTDRRLAGKGPRRDRGPHHQR